MFITKVIGKGGVVLDYIKMGFVTNSFSFPFINMRGHSIRNTSETNSVQYNIITNNGFNAKTF